MLQTSISILMSHQTQHHRPVSLPQVTMSNPCSNPTCSNPSISRCSLCKDTHYCSRPCQKAHWPAHKHHCTGHQASVVPCAKLCAQQGGGSGYEEATRRRTNDIFDSAPVPVSLRFGFPLVVARTGTAASRAYGMDNPHATWLMIDPATGLAPPEWQAGVGDVFVARKDGEPLSVAMLAAVTDYVSDILDAFGNENSRRVAELYSREKFDRFLRNHVDMQQDYQTMQARKGAE